MCHRDDPERHRIEFKIVDVFDPEDKMARYLVRLSMALGDLRIAGGTYLLRDEQPVHERMYFARLTASHLHELGILFHPPDETIPSVEEFIAAVVPSDDAETAERLRKSHKSVQRALQRTVRVPGKPTLGSELSRLRNAFFHYFNRAEYEQPLRDAMERAAGLDGVYVLRERTMRAEYADEITNKVMHPWPGLSDGDWTEAVTALHKRISALIAPVADFLHQAEATYLGSRPRGVVRRLDL
jgi:hypothetical protein